MAERLGFEYHSACGPKGAKGDSTDTLCEGDFAVDVGRVIRITTTALRERRGHRRRGGAHSLTRDVSECVRNAELYMRSHQRAHKTGMTIRH
jgi:hypothetical protein